MWLLPGVASTLWTSDWAMPIVIAEGRQPSWIIQELLHQGWQRMTVLIRDHSIIQPSFSGFSKDPPVCVWAHTQSLSCVRLCDPLGCIAHQTPLSTEFFRHDTGVGCHFLLQGTFLTQGSKLRLLHLLLTTTPPGNAQLPPDLSPKAQSYLLVQESASLPSGALALSHQMVTGRRSHRSHLPTLRLNALTPPRGLGSSWSAFPGENAHRKRAQASRHTKAWPKASQNSSVSQAVQPQIALSDWHLVPMSWVFSPSEKLSPTRTIKLIKE